MKTVTDYTEQELEDKIKAIKVLRETAEKISKHCKEELERRKQKAQLGVPLKRTLTEAPCEAVFKNFIELFSSEESANKFADYFANFVEALQNIAEGKPIDIKVLLPLLKKGKIAFCPILRAWFWTNETPKLSKGAWGIYGDCIWINGFNIKPPENWETSLMECGL